MIGFSCLFTSLMNCLTFSHSTDAMRYLIVIISALVIVLISYFRAGSLWSYLIPGLGSHHGVLELSRDCQTTVPLKCRRMMRAKSRSLNCPPFICLFIYASGQSILQHIYVYISKYVYICLCVCIRTYIYICTHGLPRWQQWERIHLPVEETQETQVWSLGWEDSPGWGHGNLLQYSCLENPMDRGAWRATAQDAAKSQTWLSN